LQKKKRDDEPKIRATIGQKPVKGSAGARDHRFGVKKKTRKRSGRLQGRHLLEFNTEHEKTQTPCELKQLAQHRTRGPLILKGKLEGTMDKFLQEKKLGRKNKKQKTESTGPYIHV